MASVLVDTGIWYAICDKDDGLMDDADVTALYELIRPQTIVMPWPIAYEVLRTSFCKNPFAMDRFERELGRLQIERLSDTPYREKALLDTFQSRLKHGKTLSFVDCIIRLTLSDRKNRIGYLATLNEKDFSEVCQARDIQILP